MKTLWRFIGIMAFWLSWPALYVRLRQTSRVRIVLIHQGKVLLVRNWYNSGQWQLPGGGIRDGETAKQAALREVTEEVGIDISADDIQQLSRQNRVVERGLSFDYQAFVTHVPSPAFTVKKYEIVDGCWYDLSHLPRNISESTKQAVGLVEKSP